MTVWKGAWYYRKRGNSWRNRNTGAIIRGSQIRGVEVTKQHYYSADTGRTLHPARIGLVSERSRKSLAFRPRK